MSLNLNMKTDYAVRAMLYLAAQKDEQCISLEEMARFENVPKEFLAKVLRSLKEAGLVHSERGSRGGYRIGKSLEDISLLDIVECIEGKIFFVNCLESQSSCQRMGVCSVYEVWQDAVSSFVKVLGNKKLSELNFDRHKNHFREHLS